MTNDNEPTANSNEAAAGEEAAKEAATRNAEQEQDAPAKSAESPDEKPENLVAGTAPAGYDEKGNPLASQEERLAAHSQQDSEALAKKIGDRVGSDDPNDPNNDDAEDVGS